MDSATGGLARGAVRRALCGLVLAVIGAGAMPAAAGSFQPVGSMAEGLYDPVVVTLADGSALVAGGWKYDPNREAAYGTAIAERFDPTTNQFAKVGPMGQPHMSNAAVLLADGRVAVLGGTVGPRPNDPDVLDAELYDPASGTFTRTGKMSALRGNPTASLLPDGRVLIAGGWTYNETPPSVEFFDPATGQFTPGPPMIVRRYRHSAVTLPDGRIVLLGGLKLDNSLVKEVEIYDPKNNSFAAAGSLVEARQTAQATLLPDGRILIAGGHGANGRLDSIEVYDPATSQSTVAAHFPRPVGEDSLVMLRDGRILSAGGIGAPLPGGESNPAGPNIRDLLPAWIIMSGTFAITPAGPMVQPRDIPGAALLGDGRALILGGLGFDAGGKFGPLASAEVYGP